MVPSRLALCHPHYPNLYLLNSLSCMMAFRDTFGKYYHQPIPIVQAFETILKDLKLLRPVPTSLPTKKRSTHPRSKNIKSLSLTESSPKKEDIHFINSLMAGDIAKLAKSVV